MRRALGLAPIVTLIVSFAIVFGLGTLIGPTDVTPPTGGSVATTQAPPPEDPDDSDDGSYQQATPHSGKDQTPTHKPKQGGHPGPADQ